MYMYILTIIREHVHAVYAGEGGIFSVIQNGSLLIDCSTIDRKDVIAMSEEAQSKGATFIDAPVSGGI